MESLKDLGPDSQYLNTDALVNPDFESQPPQDAARRSPGGTSSWVPGSRAARTPECGGRCRRSPTRIDTTITTEDSTSLLNQNAQQIGSETIKGATTIQLTNAEREQADNSGSLWTQGGVPGDPVLTAVPRPGVRVRGAALRHRRPQRRQRRVHLLPGRDQARVLLRHLRQTPADVRSRSRSRSGSSARRRARPRRSRSRAISRLTPTGSTWATAGRWTSSAPARPRAAGPGR